MCCLFDLQIKILWMMENSFCRNGRFRAHCREFETLHAFTEEENGRTTLEQINSVVQSKMYYIFFAVGGNPTQFCKNADAPLH